MELCNFNVCLGCKLAFSVANSDIKDAFINLKFPCIKGTHKDIRASYVKLAK